MRRLGLPLFRLPDGLVTETYIRLLGRRILAFYGPEALADQSREQFTSYVREKWTTAAESKPDWTTFESAFADIEKLLVEGKINHAESTDLIEFYRGKQC